MNERLAFFCNRDTAPCHLYTWAGAGADGASDGGPGGDALFQVCCRNPVDQPPADAGGPPLELGTLQTWVALAAGGLIAATRPLGDGAQLRVVTIPGPGYDPATALLLLRPGQEPAWQPAGNDLIALGPGAFVLLPATRADQSNLEALLEHLHRLPGDYRGLLLNVLRRPGLEGALWRLERQLERRDGAATGAGAGREPSPTRWVAGRWVLAALLVLNLLATLGSAWWIKQSPGPAAAPPSDTCEQMLTPGPGPDWSRCGPPWLRQDPLAPGGLTPASGAAPATLNSGAEKPHAKP